MVSLLGLLTGVLRKCESARAGWQTAAFDPTRKWCNARSWNPIGGKADLAPGRELERPLGTARFI
jgi:hypothetical protein